MGTLPAPALGSGPQDSLDVSISLGIKPSNYDGESAEDTVHSKKRYQDTMSIHGDTVTAAAASCRQRRRCRTALCHSAE